MHRRPIIIGNWKMHTTLADASLLTRQINHIAETIDDVDIVLLPPVIWLPTLLTDLHHRPRSLQFGVQNFYPETEGAFTGEIGLGMVKNLAQYALIGHSERRLVLHETDEFINRKVQAALNAKLHPIICVGELTPVMLKSRGRGRPTLLQTQSDVLRQLRAALAGVSVRDVERLIICYEPLWAVGTDENVSGPHVQAVLEQFRTVIALQFGRAAAERVRTIYGGSVSPETIHEYTTQPDIDGVLVGRASLSVRTFMTIAEAVAHRAAASSHHGTRQLGDTRS